MALVISDLGESRRSASLTQSLAAIIEGDGVNLFNNLMGLLLS